MREKNLLDRFWKKVDIQGKDDCWNWKAGLYRTGYAMFSIRNNHMRASRFVWMIMRGDIPAGMHVCHHCDNRICVNPNHLFLGTPKDNAQDKMAKGRGVNPRGLENGKAKLSDEQVREIRTLFLGDNKQKQIAKIYHVTSQYISDICRLKRRNYVTP